MSPDVTVTIRSYVRPTVFLLDVAQWFIRRGRLWPIGYAIVFVTPFVYRMGWRWHVLWIGPAVTRKARNDAAWLALEEATAEARRILDGDPTAAKPHGVIHAGGVIVVPKEPA